MRFAQFSTVRLLAGSIALCVVGTALPQPAQAECGAYVLISRPLTQRVGAIDGPATPHRATPKRSNDSLPQSACQGPSCSTRDSIPPAQPASAAPAAGTLYECVLQPTTTPHEHRAMSSIEFAQVRPLHFSLPPDRPPRRV